MTDKKQNEVSESKEIPHEINSVSDLSQILQALGEPKEGHTRFFRGHADKDWQMLPSIYRAKHLIENEDKIIKDALTYCPDDFAPSDTLFEKLVKLQHYGYSTRLLDLTANALVALYFAAWNEQHYKKDGELIILDISYEQIKYGDSDTVSILAAISLQPKPFDLRELKNKVAEEAKIETEIRALDETNKILAPEISKKFLCEQNSEAEKLFHNSSKGSRNLVNYDDVFLSLFNKSEDIISMLHIIHTDKPSFRPVIETSDLQRVICVRAKLNNQRISRQQGCFLLFGIKDNKTEAAAIPAEWQPSALSSQKILVKAESKAAIMKELKSFGISKRTLFPELEAQATEIMEQYNPDSKKP